MIISRCWFIKSIRIRVYLPRHPLILVARERLVVWSCEDAASWLASDHVPFVTAVQVAIPPASERGLAPSNDHPTYARCSGDYGNIVLQRFKSPTYIQLTCCEVTNLYHATKRFKPKPSLYTLMVHITFMSLIATIWIFMYRHKMLHVLYGK